MRRPGRSPATSRRRGPAPLVALLALLTACGEDGPGPAVATSLLERAPDLRLEELGTLVPEPASQWHGLGGDGWLRRTELRADGTPYVVNHTVTATLDLPATGPRERVLSFEAWIASSTPEEQERGACTVSLGGSRLGELALSTRPRPQRLVAPAELWRRGENRLELVVPPSAYRAEGEGLALGPVTYDTERRVAFERGSELRLPPGTGVRYTTMPFPGASLAVEGTGPGPLELTLRVLDPLTSRVLATVGPRTVSGEQGVLGAVQRLPAEDGRPVEVELACAAGAAEGLVLREVELAESRSRARPPIVLVSIDTLSARHLSLYGYRRETSPHLDALARGALLPSAGRAVCEPGVVFERCHSNAPWTSPSYVSLFTGLFPTSVSMSPGGQESRFLTKLPEGRLTMAEALRANGYRTAGFVDALHLDERFGFAQGFEHFDFSAGELPLTDPEGGFRHILPRALDWVDSLPKGAPFFLFVHVYDVHGPYLPPEPFAGRFAADAPEADGRELPTGTLPHTFGGIPEYIASGWPEEPVPPRLPSAPFVSAYDEGILAMDASLGELFEALADRGLLRDALVVFTADHGESVDDHDYVGHGLLYEEVLHVPLVVWPPRAWRTGRTPERVATSVQLVDLFPTLLELVGPPAGRRGLHGRSLAPLLVGDTLPPAPVFGEGGIMRQAAVELSGWKLIESEPGVDSLPWTMLSNPRFPEAWTRENLPELAGRPLTAESVQALLERPPEELLSLLDEIRAQLGGSVLELYDLERDPGEKEDLAASHPDEVERLLRHLREARVRREEARRAVEETLVPLSAQDLDELEKLGYVDGG